MERADTVRLDKSSKFFVARVRCACGKVQKITRAANSAMQIVLENFVKCLHDKWIALKCT